MPLHLLGKKSWNVYNTTNIERVRRDEAAARLKEEAGEQRMQEQDAERRLATLRGEVPPPLPGPDSSTEIRSSVREPREPRKKRKRQGEDDTDFELRLARERQEQQYQQFQSLAPPTTLNTPDDLVDSKGHLTLFTPQQTHAKHPDVEKEKKQQLAEQAQLRLGPGTVAGAGDAWYATPDDRILSVVPSKNVFGKDDPNRKAREAARLVSSDPLAMMKSGAAKVRELEKERRKVNEEKERELRELEKAERRERRHRHRDRSSDRRRHRDRNSSRERRHRERSRSRDRHRSERDSRRRRSRSPSPKRTRHEKGGHHSERSHRDRNRERKHTRSRDDTER